MKRKVLLIFIMVFWMVAACTFLSMKIEVEMIPQVTAISPDRMMGSSTELPLDCLFTDDSGTHLYTLYEGAGWEAGTRIQEELGGYMVGEDSITLESGWGDYVQYSSKALSPGELVEVVKGSKKEPDYWLIIPQDGAAELVEAEAPAPFMEDRARSILAAEPGTKIYSLADMEAMLTNIRLLAVILGVMLAAIAIWIYSWRLSRNGQANRWYLAADLALGAVLLMCVPMVLDLIDLPSSLLPPEHITDVGHYVQEFREFFGGLENFAGSTAPATEALSQLHSQLWMSIGIVTVLPLLAIILGVAEDLLCRKGRDRFVTGKSDEKT